MISKSSTKEQMNFVLIENPEKSSPKPAGWTSSNVQLHQKLKCHTSTADFIIKKTGSFPRNKDTILYQPI